MFYLEESLTGDREDWDLLVSVENIWFGLMLIHFEIMGFRICGDHQLQKHGQNLIFPAE